MSRNALISKLTAFADLSEKDRQQINGLCDDVRKVPAKRTIISEGDRPDNVHLIVSGWAARYVMMPDGSRQIVAFLIPGDFCDLHVALLGQMDHTIVAISACRVAFIPSEKLDRLTSQDSGVTKALWWGTLVDEAVLRAWIANVGRRDAHERIAHLLCELHLRLKLVGLVFDGTFDLPITQEEIADATGLTSVHTNRMLQRLRAENVIDLKRGLLKVLDIERLREVAGFDASYLHMKRRQAI